MKLPEQSMYNKEKAMDEASKMQEKIKSGEVKNFTDAEISIELNKIKSEIMPPETEVTNTEKYTKELNQRKAELNRTEDKKIDPEVAAMALKQIGEDEKAKEIYKNLADEYLKEARLNMDFEKQERIHTIPAITLKSCKKTLDKAFELFVSELENMNKAFECVKETKRIIDEVKNDPKLKEKMSMDLLISTDILQEKFGNTE
ncbi:hypothetical protein KAJ61_03300 [Candidatus Parcubacteria bacterium]|nr:hypothetical protein [Candidatus Parcubacteria bacterium]